MLIWIEDVHRDNTHPLLPRHAKSRFLPHTFSLWKACHQESGVNAMDLVDNPTERPTTELLERTCFLFRRLKN